MKVGILGLGLIGGSLARAYAKAGHTIYAWDQDETILSFAQLAGAVQGVLDEETIPFPLRCFTIVSRLLWSKYAGHVTCDSF